MSERNRRINPIPENAVVVFDECLNLDGVGFTFAWYGLYRHVQRNLMGKCVDDPVMIAVVPFKSEDSILGIALASAHHDQDELEVILADFDISSQKRPETSAHGRLCVDGAVIPLSEDMAEHLLDIHDRYEFALIKGDGCILDENDKKL